MRRIKKEGLAKKMLSAVLLVLLCLTAYGCAEKSAMPPNVEPAAEKSKAMKGDDVVAVIGDRDITVSEYEQEVAMLPPVYRGIAISNKRQFLDSLINKQLLLEEAKRLHLENNENVKKLFLRAKDEIMIQELIGMEITDRIKINESDIEEYYHANKDKYTAPARTRASHILVDSDVVAQKVLSDIRGGADFAAVCKEYSLDLPTKDLGGDMGYFIKGSLLPEFEEACDSLEIGGTSGVVKTSLGCHLIKVTDRKDAEPRQISEVQSEIENELFIEKQIALYDELMNRLKKDKEIKVDTAIFDKIEAE